jgi:hypothetical protein
MKSIEWYKKEGDKIGAKVYEMMPKNLDYEEKKLLADHIYAGLFEQIYRSKEYKK